MENQITNVAPSSTSGHFVHNAIRVVEIDNIAEAFFIDGKSELRTKNHTTLVQEESCLITTQVVYNPFARMFEKARD